MQKVDYSYNIRGWLKSINDIDNLSQSGSPTDLFAFKLNYNTIENESIHAGKELFNGNISETYWRTNNDNFKRKYSYHYDEQNRMKSAIYQRPNNSSPLRNNYDEHVFYDKNGNITQLIRNGEHDDTKLELTIDILNYTYHPTIKNQLMKVMDETNSPAGFKDDSDGITDIEDDYSYDDFGNMIKDDNKSIKSISYNHLNLPVQITFGGATTRKIDYLYNATGVKVKKTVTDGTLITETDYLDGYQYVKEGSNPVALTFFPHAEGYVNNTVVNNANVYNYVYNYTDHLGNVRVVYTKDPTDGLVKILEENNYYPYGMKHKNYNISYLSYKKAQDGGINILPVCSTCPIYYKYKYNGKEFQDELGLNFYDYGARNYDSALGRWMNMDPFSEKYVGLSPYSFAANSPILLTDPDGRDIVFSWQRDDNGNITGINISVTGKVIDDTKNKELSEKQLQKYKDRIIKGLTENIKSEDENFSINVTANIDIAQSEDDLSETDHAFRITDEVKKKAGHTDPNVDVDGFSVKGENFVYLDKNFKGRTVAHEIGHSAGLDHIKQEKKNGEHGKPTDFLGFSSTGYKHYRLYTTNFYPGNLMHQSLDPNPGNTLTRWQFNKMMSLYDTKQLNNGKQKVN